MKYYHVICKFLFGKQESAGKCWNQIRNQAKIVHDSESLQQELIVAGPSDHYLIIKLKTSSLVHMEVGIN